MEALLGWLSHYGYFGLFGLLVLGIVGLPIPDETLLVFSGYLISQRRFHPALTFASGFAGAACGISLSYYIGRTLGYRAVTRYGRFVHLTPERLDRVHRWFQQMGEWVLAIGYFVPGVRHFTALTAGISRLEFPTFALFAYSGAALWVATFLTVGYFVGENWRATLSLVERYRFAALLAVVVLVVLLWWMRRRRAW